MAREPRKRSNTGIYHIMLRGLDKRDIFMDDEDREKFIKAIMQAKKAGGFILYAYCLMDNHVHLLIKEDEEIGTSLKRITVSYVQWHNNKYGRVGHMFQNRFKSEVVESDSYFLTVLRYIHQNPIKAKIVKSLTDYHWSSYNEYLKYYSGFKVAVDTEIIKGYFNIKEKFQNYMEVENEDKCLEHQIKIKYTDTKLKELIETIYGLKTVQRMKGNERNEKLRLIKEKTNASNRQLSRVLDITRSTLERATKGI